MMVMETHQPHDDRGFDATTIPMSPALLPWDPGDPSPWVPPTPGDPSVQDWVLVATMMVTETHQPQDDHGGFDATTLLVSPTHLPWDPGHPKTWVPPLPIMGDPSVQDWVLVAMMMVMETHQPHDDRGFDATTIMMSTALLSWDPGDPTP